MKLSAHYSKASIIITISVLLVGAVIYYFAINYIANNQLDSDLMKETEEVKDYIRLNHKLPKPADFDEEQTTFIPTTRSSLPIRFFDTGYHNADLHKCEAGRGVSILLTVNGRNYKTIIIVSRANTEYLLQIIAAITLALAVGLLITLFITNRFILNGLWRPFYATLNDIKAFNVADTKNFGQKTGKVDEFNELNEAVLLMSARVRTDFQHLKHFTENASHEMMTPLAVITAKLDMLIQDETLKARQFEQLTDIYTATNKLSRLNQALLLLVKIENNLIEDAELISLDLLVAEKLKQFNELLTGRHIQVEASLQPKQVTASKYLTDVLLNNFLSNAIRHNNDYGQLKVRLTKDQLCFTNSGAAAPLNADTVFERFQKGQRSEGTGLGLAIVKNICHMYGWKIDYEYADQLHTFRISF